MSLPDWPWPRIFTHRCGGTLAPENTVEALDVAARFGTGVEFDVMLSADGTPHLIHDESLERTTDGHGQVAQTRDAALATLDASAGFEAWRGARVPPLSNAAARCRELGLAVNLEIKPSHGADQRTGRVAATAAREYWRGSAVTPLLSSFSEAALEAARAAAPELPRGLLVDRLPADWESRCNRLGVVSLHADTRFITAQQVAAVRAAGLRLVLYTENDPARAAVRFAWGVDAIVTDRPDQVRAPAARP